MTALKAGSVARRNPTVVVALVTVAGLAFAIASACQIVAGYESFQPPMPHPCDLLRRTSKIDDAGVKLVLSKVTSPKSTCYWIDEAEVTFDQYNRFADSVADGGTVEWDPRCGWKDAGPSDPRKEANPCMMNMESEALRSTKPARCIDWCDAKAFCHWAGKQLCKGDTSGGFLSTTDAIDQWGKACSANGLQPYVYGPVAEAGACNVDFDHYGTCYGNLGQPVCAATDVKSFQSCVSPSGAFDMIGNVAEWVDLCGSSADAGDPDTLCIHRGGSFASTLQEATCQQHLGAGDSDSRKTRDRGLGLRCCAELNSDEANLVNP